MTERINGINLYVETHGESGPPVILVHGSWGDHHNWDRVVPLLAGNCRVTSYDRRGHSESERPSGEGSVREDVRDLAALIENLRIAPAHVVGSSFGAIITLKLLIERPDLFASATIHEPPLLRLVAGDPMLAAVQERTASVLDTLSAGQTEAGAKQFVETVAFGPGTWDQLPPAMQRTFVFNAPTWFDEMQEQEAFTLDLDSLSEFGGPVLITEGDQSPPFFHVIVERIHDAMPRGQRHIFRGAAHLPHMTHPDDYALVVGSFINGVHRL